MTTTITKFWDILGITLRKNWYLCILQIFQMRLCKRFDSNMLVFHSLHVCHLFTENYDWPLASLRRDARRVQLWWSTCPLAFGQGCWITWFISSCERNNCLLIWANSHSLWLTVGIVTTWCTTRATMVVYICSSTWMLAARTLEIYRKAEQIHKMTT